ncbi:MAG: hypothetical protein KJ069_03420 [Anaerolineae bacterium]|nr:hypothetical protein [Anaerolineae bacterium]
MSYPDNCLRGVPNGTYLIEDGSVGAHLFHFEETYSRGDGWIEQSVNWEDDGNALVITLSQHRENGELQFKAGAVRIPCAELDRLSKQPTVSGILTYERRPLENNPYHGNLLLKSDVPKPTMKKIAAGIALIVSEVIARS